MWAEDSGAPPMAPVGKGILGRMFDVFGNAIDRQPAPTETEWRSVHRAPPPLMRRSTQPEVFETGIKVHRCTGSAGAWRQGGPVRRGGRG